MAGHFLALVVGERLAQFEGHRLESAGETIEGGLGVGAVHLDQDDVARGPLDQGSRRRTLARALDQVALPMARDEAVGDLLGAIMDRHPVGQLPACSIAHSAHAGSCFSLPMTNASKNSSCKHPNMSGVLRGMNDSDASGGQQVVKSLILLVVLMMEESPCAKSGSRSWPIQFNRRLTDARRCL